MNDSIHETILKIQNGDELLRERFIRDYKPFIIRRVSIALTKFVDDKNSEEYSIGLCAFNEAIDKFDEKKYHHFMSFAGQVIKRRIVDYIRYTAKDEKDIQITSLDVYAQEDHDANLSLTTEDYFIKVEHQEEISCLEKILGEFHISIEDLVENVPKHKDARRASIEAAYLLSSSQFLFTKLMETHILPSDELSKLCDFSKRTLQRNRKFIIAVTLIFKFDFEMFKSYIKEYRDKNNF